MLQGKVEYAKPVISDSVIEKNMKSKNERGRAEALISIILLHEVRYFKSMEIITKIFSKRAQATNDKKLFA